MSNIRSSGASAASASPAFFDALPWPDNSYCEGYTDPARPRPHWQSLLSSLGKKTFDELAADNDRARRMRHEDGATINPFDDLTEQTTSWALDMVPLLLSDREWRNIEAGVKQRAHLLEQILEDTYGAQDLLKNKNVPAELVFANPNFLHQCHRVQPSGDRFLTFYAVDIYRAPDGSFRVLRDHGAKPAGLGFALENRIVISRLFSTLYHRSSIRRLAPFFQSFHQALTQRLSLRKDNPGIVLLSPGPNSHLYFEHAMLSRYLGYPLVEGQDLTVRNGSIFLKKLTGLEPVEAIFRHIDDLDSDPFALRRQTASGVAGLVQACREQNIDVVNPVGSGFIDTPLLKCFLPELCQSMLGEGLLLDNHPTWWCGSEEGTANLDSLLAPSAVMSAMQYDQWFDVQADVLAKVREAPSDYVVSAPVLPSSAPSWGDDGAYGTYCIMRIFACATENGFSVLPGGLAVTSTAVPSLLSGSPESQHSKDIWVISEEPVEPFSMMAGLRVIPKFKRFSDLPNRVADNLLWLGRYLERAEGLIRLLRAVFGCLSGEDRPEEVPALKLLLTILHEKQIIPSPPEKEQRPLSEAALTMHLKEALYTKNRPGSIVSILRNVRQTAHNVRDRLSIDSTRVINKLEDFREAAGNDPIDILDQTLLTLSAFSGLAMESMTRGLGWRFMDMGRRVERALNLASLIRFSLGQLCNDSHSTLQALLRISESVMTYRGRYRSTFQVAPVLDLLLADEGNPQSLAFQFAELADHVQYLPREDERTFASREEQIVLELLTSTRLLDLSDIHCGNNGTGFDALSAFLAKAEEQLKDFSQQLSAHYLTRIPATPHYAMISSKHSP